MQNVSGTVISYPRRHSLSAGIWRLADPKISLASMASIFLGASLAANDGPISLLWLVLTFIGLFAIEVAKNASGEVYDFDSGADQAVAVADQSPFSGGKRVLVDRLLTRGETWTVAAVGYGVGIVVGLTIVLLREPAVLWLGLAGVAAAFFYHAPPLRLSYRGFGEIAVAACYGPLIASGTYLVQRGEITATVVALSLLLGVLIAAFLWINEMPDCAGDISAGKNNLVARMGRGTARRVFPFLLGAPLVALVMLSLAGYPPGALGGLLALPFATHASVLAWRHAFDTTRLIPAQASTLLTFLAYSVGCGAGVLLW